MPFSRKTYYKKRIIFTFTGVTAGIIVLLISVSNFYIKELFTNQISDQMKDMTRYMVNRLDSRYLKSLKFGPPTESFKDYFSAFSKLDSEQKNNAEVFIFNKEFQIVIHNNSSIEYNSTDPLLTIHTDLISTIKENKVVTSLPFQTKKNKWYLWAFYKLNDDLYFAYKAETKRFNKLDQFTVYVNYFGLTSIIVICVIAVFLSKSITKPINKLVDYSLAVGKGAVTSTIPEGLKGELKILGDALDKMHKGLLNSQNEKEKILAQIAHEIRNPLGGMELLASLVKEQLAEDDKNVNYLDSILKEIFRLKSLITSFLNYSKPVPANPEWIFVGEIMEDLSSFIKNKTTDRKIDFCYKSEIDKIYFDPVHMKQILINLISNSIEAIEKEGRIFIELEKNKTIWNLKISDSGKGIPEKSYDNLFTPFFTTKKDGTGLGLAICKKLCQENHGDICVDRDSENTTIMITKEIRYE
ncbi:MAG: ATP-binding protein [Rhodothermaceae bacterium]